MRVDLLARGPDLRHGRTQFLGLTHADRATFVQEHHGLDVRVFPGLLDPVEQLAERGAADRAEGERLIGGQLRDIPRQAEDRDLRLGRSRLRTLLLLFAGSSFRLGGRFVSTHRNGRPHGQIHHQAHHYHESKNLAQSRRHRSSS